MESTVTTDDASGATLMNDVLKKTSLLIGVCTNDCVQPLDISVISGFIPCVYVIPYSEDHSQSSCNPEITD